MIFEKDRTKSSSLSFFRYWWFPIKNETWTRNQFLHEILRISLFPKARLTGYTWRGAPFVTYSPPAFSDPFSSSFPLFLPPFPHNSQFSSNKPSDISIPDKIISIQLSSSGFRISVSSYCGWRKVHGLRKLLIIREIPSWKPNFPNHHYFRIQWKIYVLLCSLFLQTSPSIHVQAIFSSVLLFALDFIILIELCVGAASNDRCATIHVRVYLYGRWPIMR